MAKHSTPKRKGTPRNASPHRARPRAAYRRNAGPRPGEDPDPTSRFVQAGLGSAITAGTGAMLTVAGANPQTTAGILTVLGAGLALKGDGEATRNVGTSIMVAAGTQLGLLMYEKSRKSKPTPAERIASRPSNAAQVHPEMVRAALERARLRFALEEQTTSEPPDWDRGDFAQAA
jgi:hypothetical protein